MGVLIVLLKAVFLAFALLILRAVVWLFNMLVVAPAFDPLRKIPGPAGDFFQSHLGDVSDPDLSPDTHTSWRKLYGDTFRFHGFGRHDYRLMTFDFRAISHIMTSPVYEKPWQTRSILATMIGRGIISMEGHEHKVQRKLMAPAFSSQSVKHLTHIFLAKAEELCDLWEKDFAPIDAPETEEQPTVDVASGLSRGAFDAMGLGGFDHAFDSLKDNTRPDHQPYRAMFRVVDMGIGPRDILDLFVPILRNLWPSEKTNIINKSSVEIQKFGRKIFERKRAKILANETDDKDILGLLVKENLASESSRRLSDKELLDQCSTVLFAGTDSVAIGLTWALQQLSTHPESQTRLYEELKASHERSKGTDDYDSDGSDDSGYVEDPAIRAAHFSKIWENSLESLSYLDNVIRETLRVCPPVHSTIRVATADDEIPLADPMCVDGRMTSTIRIRKGTFIHIPIEGVNYAEDIWGSDAREFKPERWNKLPDAAAAVPGMGHVLTFGYGPHSCLGYRFAICEMKAFLASMVLRFKFSAVEGLEIEKHNSFVTRPYIPSLGENGSQMPLHITRRRV